MKHGELSSAIIKALIEHGPMTASEICEAVGKDRDSSRSAISRLLRPQKVIPKRLHILHYIHEAEGERVYPRAVYALGDMPDAPKPKRKTHTELQRAWRERRAARITSVFDLGLNQKKRIQLTTRLGQSNAVSPQSKQASR